MLVKALKIKRALKDGGGALQSHTGKKFSEKV